MKLSSSELRDILKEAFSEFSTEKINIFAKKFYYKGKLLEGIFVYPDSLYVPNFLRDYVGMVGIDSLFETVQNKALGFQERPEKCYIGDMN